MKFLIIVLFLCCGLLDLSCTMVHHPTYQQISQAFFCNLVEFIIYEFIIYLAIPPSQLVEKSSKEVPRQKFLISMLNLHKKQSRNLSQEVSQQVLLSILVEFLKATLCKQVFLVLVQVSLQVSLKLTEIDRETNRNLF